MYHKEREFYEYNITILSVKMKVKFPCKLKIQHMGSMIAPEVSTSGDDRYIFNQEVCLRDEQQRDYLELVFNIVTQMGSKYLAGAVKMYPEEMARSEGETINFSLVRCLDTQAKCEIKVNQVILNKSSRISVRDDDKKEMKRPGINNFRSNEHEEIERSPTMKNIYGGSKHVNSRTQYEFPLGKTVGSSPDWATRSRFHHVAQKLQSPSSKIHQQSLYESKDQNINVQDCDDNYRQAYMKMKQRYKKEKEEHRREIEKRKGCENNENALKLEIMRCKMKNEELERAISDRDSRHKIGENALKLLQLKESEVRELNVEIQNRNLKIQALEDTLKVLSERLEGANRYVQERQAEETYKTRDLKLQLQDMQRQHDQTENELKYLLEVHQEAVKNKDRELLAQIKIRQQLNLKIDALEANIHSKQTQFERILDSNSRSFQQRNEEQNQKLKTMQVRMKSLQEENETAFNKIHQLQLSAVRGQYERQMLQKQSLTLREQLNSYREKAEKYPALLQNYQLLIDEKAYLEKKVQKLDQSRQETDSFIQKQFQEQIQYLKEISQSSECSVESKTRQIRQLEKQVSDAKLQQDRMKKTIEELTQELSESKDKQKIARRAMFSKEKQFFGAETEHATLKEKVKNIDQIYQLEADKIRGDLQKTELVLDAERKKAKQTEQKCTFLTFQLTETQSQLSEVKQNLEKLSQILSGKEEQFETIIKSHEQKIVTLEKIASMLKTTEKEAVFRMKKIELDSTHFEERMEKMKIDYGNMQEKCLQLEQQCRNQASEIVQLSEQKEELKQANTRYEEQISEMKNEIMNTTSEKIRLNKIFDLIQEEHNQGKRELQHERELSGEKEQKMAKLNMDCNTLKEEASKMRIKIEMLRKEGERFKGEVLEGINKNNAIILGRENNKDKGDSESRNQLNFAQFLSLLNSHFKELRTYSTKQKELISKLDIEIDNLKESKEDFLNNSHKKQYDLKNEIAHMETELQKIIEQRQSESLNFTTIITEMKKKMEEGQKLQEELNSQIEELNFTVNSTKMDYEALTDENNRKLIQMTKLNTDLSKKNNQCMEIIDKLQEKIVLYEAQMELVNFNLAEEVDKNEKKQKTIEEMKEANRRQIQELEILKKSRKELLEKITQLQLQIGDAKDESQKIKIDLNSQERKNAEMKEFVSNLMKEKEMAIGKEAKYCEEIMNLQSEIIEKTKDIELLTQQLNRTKQSNEELKQNIKKHNNGNMDLSLELRDLKSEYLKVQEKIKQKQLLLQFKEESMSTLELKIQASSERHKDELNSIQNDFDKKSNLFDQQERQLKQTIKKLEDGLQRKTTDLGRIQLKNIEFQQRMYEQHQKIETLSENIDILKSENEQLKSKISQLDSGINELSDQLRDKEEKLFDLSGKIFSLQKRIQAEVEEKYETLQTMQADFINKYEMMSYEYEQKLQMLEKEKDFYKREIQEKDRDITKKNIEVNSLEDRESNMRKKMEQRINKLQEDKLILNSTKNSEINRLTEQNLMMIDSLKQKDVQTRKLISELEMSRRSITNLEYKMREYEEKAISQSKQNQTEVDFYKRKENEYRSFRENASTRQWNTEREIKRILQTFVRNYLEMAQNQNSNKVVDLARTLEGSVLEAVSWKQSEEK